MNINNPIQLFKVFMSEEAIYKTTKTLFILQTPVLCLLTQGLHL
jgi:hypothetical protein